MSDVQIEDYDSVYCRLTGDKGYIRTVAEQMMFYVPGYKFNPRFKSGFWDGKIRLVNLSTGQFYAGLKSKVEGLLREAGAIVTSDPSPAPPGPSWQTPVQWLGELKLPANRQPRDFQLKGLELAAKLGRRLFVSPTASGKSLIMYLIYSWFNEKTLVVVPRTNLVEQLVSDFESYGWHGEASKIYSGHDHDPQWSLTVSTWQSIVNYPPEWFDQFSLFLGDECHRFSAKSLKYIMEKTGRIPWKFGFTGTLDESKTHQMVLEGLFGPVSTLTTIAELQQKKQIAEAEVKAIKLIHPESVRKNFKKLAGNPKAKKVAYDEEIDYLCRCVARNRFIANLVMKLPGNTMVLFNYIEKHGHILYELLKDSKKVYYVHGGVKTATREESRQSLEQETGSVALASFGTFSEGVNITNLDNLIIASPVKSVIRLKQSLGRGLRRSESKTSLMVYDLGDDISWKSSVNHTFDHFTYRLHKYAEEGIPYSLVPLDLPEE